MNLFSSIRPIRLLALTICISLVGCASVTPMALNKSSKTVDVSSKSVVLMTLDVTRSEPSRYVPNPLTITFEKPGTSDQPAVQSFQLKNTDRIRSKDGHDIYVLSMALEPGQYRIGGVFGDANAFPFHGFFFVPLLMDVQIPQNAVTYMGRVKAVLRPRQENEFRAGGVIPLIDQSVTGVSTGTFDVTVTDSSQEDLAFYQSNYPALSAAKINTLLLPAFDRPKVQLWWDGGSKTESKADTKTPVSQVSTPSQSTPPIAVAEKAR